MTDLSSVVDTPLSLATGRLRDLLIGLAERYEDDPARPCCDGDTTLRDWIEARFGDLGSGEWTEYTR